MRATEKQRAARTRNWNIHQLRGYFHLCPPVISPSVRFEIENLIDRELNRLGAESESSRVAKRRKEMAEEDQ